jgi:hypothetical protein
MRVNYAFDRAGILTEGSICGNHAGLFFVRADNLFEVTYYENGFRAPGLTARGGVKVRIR